VSDPKYRVAVVGGAGTWGSRYLRAYAEHADCEVIALVDSARDRRREFADHYGVANQLDSLEELLAGELPDIVSIVLPVAENPRAVIACAEAGVKVVSCEKPMAVALRSADEMVRVCRERGTVFCCGSVYSGVPYLRQTLDWIGEGHLGRITGAAIPGGLPHEVAGGGCVQLTILRLLTGLEVEWVEGWTLPPEPGWSASTDGSGSPVDSASDCPAYGRLGLSGGVICEIPRPEINTRCLAAVTGERGQVFIGSPRPIFIAGAGAASSPVNPEFFDRPPGDGFTALIERLMRASITGRELFDSGRGYHQALEIAMALKLSAQRDHERLALPLPDRSQRIVPHPYRLRGGDVAGWESIGYSGPPRAS
jgi:predicted dehydrogenase